MSRRKRSSAATPAADLGPRIAGALRADVAVADRADPDNPNRTIRGASRRSGYDWLHARGVISDTQREAADRYCVAHERLSGGNDRASAAIARVPPWLQGHPAQQQVQASADIRAVHAWIGQTSANRRTLDGVVLEGRTLDSMATLLSEPMPGILGRLRAVLDIMAEQWGIE
jgi:hypothetical protein